MKKEPWEARTEDEIAKDEDGIAKDRGFVNADAYMEFLSRTHKVTIRKLVESILVDICNLKQQLEKKP